MYNAIFKKLRMLADEAGMFVTTNSRTGGVTIYRDPELFAHVPGNEFSSQADAILWLEQRLGV